MASDKLVLIVTQEFDPHADSVIMELNKRNVNVLRFHTFDFPLRSTLIAEGSNSKWNGTIEFHGRLIYLNQVTSVWYRRPRRFELDSMMTLSEQSFAESEIRAALGGLLRSMDCLWVNHPEKLVSANYKPYQLKVARTLGLEIPATLITNDPEAVIRFYKACKGHVIYKPLSHGMIASEDGSLSSIYTSRVTLEDLQEAQRVRQTPCLFQEYVHKKLEIRINVIGDQVFAVEIHSQNSERSATDWRKSYEDLTYDVYYLPEDIQNKCLAITRHLGLAFGAIDMVLTPDGRYVFLEINPNGQWGWLEDRTGLPLRKAHADLLSS